MFKSTKVIELGSCAFRQPTATSHCKFLHGYRLTAKFWFEADSLDQNNWVVDFGGLKDLKMLLQDQFDHTTCVSVKDPKLPLFKQLFDEGVCDLRIMDGVGIEKFAEWCWTVADKHVVKITDGRCKCVKVEVFEHENNSAIYEKRKIQETQEPESVDDKTTKKIVEEANKDAVVTDQNKKAKPAVVNTNINKQTNRWVDPNSTNSWGL
jgi:6-pyruvoyltetrahydropterin/6-carboxytetrahydropterin synthase